MHRLQHCTHYTKHLRRPNADAWMEGGRQSHTHTQNSKRAAGDTAPSSRLVEEWTKGKPAQLCKGTRVKGARVKDAWVKGTRGHHTCKTPLYATTTPSHKMGGRQIRRQHGHQNLWKPTHWRWKPTQLWWKGKHWWRQIHRQHGHQNGNVYF